MPSVVQLIHEIGARHATRPALVDLVLDENSKRYRRTRITNYAQLHEATLRLADALASKGLKAGDRVAVLFDNSFELVVSEWACLVSGLVWVALNVRSSAAEHAAILADSRPSAVIVASRHADRIDPAALSPGCLVVGTETAWDALLVGGRTVKPAYEPGPEDAVRIRYTSGTAGQPKGAVLPRRCYDASVEIVTDVIGPLFASDVLAQVGPMTHAAGAMFLPHAAVGAVALLADRFDAKAFVDLALREGVTSAFLVPTMLVRVIEELVGSPRPESIRSIVYGGAAMPVDRLERGLQRLGPVFVQIYGLTESNWPVTALRREEHVVTGDEATRRARLASCGRPTAVGEVRIVRENGTEVRVGESGELLVRGRNTMLGYWGKGRGDAKGLDEHGWMHTGDVAVRDAAGFVTVVDRLHDMIVSGGFNVYPREVEDALSSHSSVLEAAVVGRADAEWGERVHAVVVLREGAIADETVLGAHVASCTAPYKKPRTFDFVHELPKNAAGKVLRRALKTTKPPV